MRIMAIDYGDARTGIAISDPTGLLAGYTTVIHSRKSEVVAEEIARLVKEHGVEELVMGFPRNMDGTEGPRAELYRAFAQQVGEVTGLTPVLWDERHTTVEANSRPELIHNNSACSLPQGTRNKKDRHHSAHFGKGGTEFGHDPWE